MSVPKSKRSHSDLEVITKANELAAYTIQICSNEKHFPKRYRWCITNKIVDCAIDISKYALAANSIFVGDDVDAYKLRKQFQTVAITNTYTLLSLMDIAYRAFGIEGDRMTYWTGLVLNVQKLLRAWKKADGEKYKGWQL